MNQITPPCIVCGMDADDTHHGRPHDLSQGKGAGGTAHDDAEHFTYVPLCRQHHDALHAKEIRMKAEGPLMRTVDTQTGEVLAVRALHEKTLAEVEITTDMAGISTVTYVLDDDSLLSLYGRGQDSEAFGTVLRAFVASAFAMRYGGYGKRWYERVAQMISDHVGYFVAPQTVQDYRLIGESLRVMDGDPEQNYRVFGYEILRLAGRTDDPLTTINEAGYLLDRGISKKLVCAELRAQDKPFPCASTGQHRASAQFEWDAEGNWSILKEAMCKCGSELLLSNSEATIGDGGDDAKKV